MLARALLLVLVLVLPASAQMGQPRRTPVPSPPPQPPRPVNPGGGLDFLPPAQGCQTQWGICPLACCVAPGTPCYCVTPSNAQITGYAVQYYYWP